jgi:magnesium transporter
MPHQSDSDRPQFGNGGRTTFSHQRVVRASGTSGLPPGSLVYVGEREPIEVRITITAFSSEGTALRTVHDIDDALPLDPSWTVTWIDVVGLSSIPTVQEIGDRFAVHPLVLEDILNTRARPKFEVFDDYVYFSLKALLVEKGSEEVVVEPIRVLLGKGFVITLREVEEDLFRPVRARIEVDGRIRQFGADYLAYALVDVIVDGYFAVLERLDERIEDLEEQVLARPTPETLREVHRLRRAMLDLRHVLWPVREVVAKVERIQTPLIDSSVVFFYRDIYDHTVQMIETIESLRDVVAGMLDIYLSSVSYRLNQVIKVLTIFSTIFMPLTFLVGVYGMNFDVMPELHLPWAYPLLWVIMIGIAVSMIAWFRNKRWI